MGSSNSTEKTEESSSYFPSMSLFGNGNGVTPATQPQDGGRRRRKHRNKSCKNSNPRRKSRCKRK